MQVVLVMFREGGERRSFSLAKNVTVVGRREDCDLRIPLGDVSRKHCRFIKDGEALRLEDLGSSNGTYHNGQRVQEAVVEAGDNVQVGPVTFVVQIDGMPADEELQPPVAMAASEDTAAGTYEEPATEAPAEEPQGNDPEAQALAALESDDPAGSIGGSIGGSLGGSQTGHGDSVVDLADSQSQPPQGR